MPDGAARRSQRIAGNSEYRSPLYQERDAMVEQDDRETTPNRFWQQGRWRRQIAGKSIGQIATPRSFPPPRGRERWRGTARSGRRISPSRSVTAPRWLSARRAPADYDRSVFINCPFDDGYRPLFRAAGLRGARLRVRAAVRARGLRSGQVRIEKIVRLIEGLPAGASTTSRGRSRTRERPAAVQHAARARHLPRRAALRRRAGSARRAA